VVRCSCVDLNDCPAHEMDFGFGRSCKYGQVSRPHLVCSLILIIQYRRRSVL
jgi:hypothetical protein